MQFEVLECTDIHQVQRPRGTADLVGDVVGAGVVDVGDGHFRAAPGQFPRTRRPDSAGAAGDESRTAVEVVHRAPASANCSRSAASIIARSTPLVSRMNSAATKVMIAATAR